MRTLTLLMLAAASTLTAQVRSDFETVRAFEREMKRLSAAIDSAQTVQECGDLRVSIDQLKQEYAEDKKLLDKSLYGENFDQRFERISGKLVLAERKIGVIESQIVRIVELETQVRELSAKVVDLTAENARLLSDVDRLSENIKGLSASGMEAGNMVDSLRGVVRRLQRGLRERDEMIFALVDSLFLQYDKDLAQVGENEMQGIAIKLDRNNVIAGVITSIESNIKFLERAELSGSDLASIVKEHARFSSQWKGIGPKLASIYVSKRHRAGELAAIDTLLASWSSRADEAQWRELNRAFSSNGLAVPEFWSGTDFVASLSVYIDNADGSDSTAAVGDTAWATFDRLWSEELADSWIPLLVERGSITAEDSAVLHAKVEAWRSEMTPTSPFVYALIFVLIVSLLAVAYTRYLKNKPVGS